VSVNFLLQVNRTTPYEMDRDREGDSLYEGMHYHDVSDEGEAVRSSDRYIWLIPNTVLAWLTGGALQPILARGRSQPTVCRRMLEYLIGANLASLCLLDAMV
jgi:hypothetical protein